MVKPMVFTFGKITGSTKGKTYGFHTSAFHPHLAAEHALINGLWRIQGTTRLATAQDHDAATRRDRAQLGVGATIL